MKYVGFWTIKPEHMEKAIENYSKLLELKEGEGVRAHFPKSIGDNYNYCGQTKGFQIFEVENPDQMSAITSYYNPYIQFEFIPIDNALNTTKIFMKVKEM